MSKGPQIILLSILASATWLLIISSIQANIGTMDTFWGVPINGITTILVFTALYNFMLKRWSKQTSYRIVDKNRANETNIIESENETLDKKKESANGRKLVNNQNPRNLQSTEYDGKIDEYIKMEQMNSTKEGSHIQEERNMAVTHNFREMKIGIQIISVILLLVTLLLTITCLDTKHMIGYRNVNIEEDIFIFIIFGTSILTVFLTLMILISPQILLRKSYEQRELLQKDNILQTKLSVLKKEKELLEIQKDIDSLKSASSHSKSM